VRICNTYPEKQKPHYISWFSYPMPNQRIKAPSLGEAGILYETTNRSNRIFLPKLKTFFLPLWLINQTIGAYAAISNLKN